MAPHPWHLCDEMELILHIYNIEWLTICIGMIARHSYHICSQSLPSHLCSQ